VKKILILTTGGAITSSIVHSTSDKIKPTVITKEIILSVLPTLNSVATVIIKEVMREESENFNYLHWQEFTKIITKEIDKYDGFVITQGETVPYTSAALSFTLQGINKPVVLLSSRVSLFDQVDDTGRNELLKAIEFASQKNLKGVFVSSKGNLLLGTRVKKDFDDYGSFASVNVPPAASILEEKITINKDVYNCYLKTFPKTFFLQNEFNNGVEVHSLYPGMSPEVLFYRLFTNKPKVFLLVAYGSGCVPNRGEFSIIPFLHEAQIRGIPVFVVSRTFQPSTSVQRYTMGEQELEYEILPAYDMNYETAVVKLQWILGQTSKREVIIEMFYKSYAGEINEYLVKK